MASTKEEFYVDGVPISDLRVVDLKEQLEKRGLSKIGKKVYLVKRLRDHLAQEKQQESQEKKNPTKAPKSQEQQQNWPKMGTANVNTAFGNGGSSPSKKRLHSSATSHQWREHGNDYYKQAGEASTLTNAADYLKKAVHAYEEALNLATDDKQRCYALRNMGMANLHLGKNCNQRALAAVNEKHADGSSQYQHQSNHRTEYNPYIMLHFYKEAIKSFCRCVPLIDRLKPSQPTKTTAAGGDSSAQSDNFNLPEFVGKLNSNVNECAQEALSYLTSMDYFSTYKARTEQLEYLIGALGDKFRDWSAVYHLEKAKTYHKWAVTEMDRSKNHVTALHCLKECYSPLEIVRSLLPAGLDKSSDEYLCGLEGRAFGKFTIRHREELEDLIHSVRADTAIAEAMQLIQKGDKHLQLSVLESEQLNVDGVYEAIDNYRRAIVTLRDLDGLDFVLEAEAFSKIGQIYFNVLKNVAQGKTHCMNAVHLAGMLQQNFAGKDWFDKAMAIVKQIQDEQRKAEEEQVRKDREPFLKELEKELKELEEYDDKSAETIIADFPKKFPPKHKADSKVMDDLAKKEFTSKTPRADVKKALTKLILLYHPDHVEVTVHGGKYFVLCEEITKVITRKYECFKG